MHGRMHSAFSGSRLQVCSGVVYSLRGTDGSVLAGPLQNHFVDANELVQSTQRTTAKEVDRLFLAVQRSDAFRAKTQVRGERRAGTGSQTEMKRQNL